MKILAVGAHPDDIEFGCGGVLIKFVEAGHKVFLSILSEGETKAPPPLRMLEQEKSADIMGISGIFWNGKDGDIKVDRKHIDNIEKVVNLIEPDIVFCPWEKDIHQDHEMTSKLVLIAARRIKNVLFCETISSRDFNPGMFSDVSSICRIKLNALRAHVSQVPDTGIDGLDMIQMSEATMRHRGMQCRVSAAEGFVPFKYFAF